MKKYLLLTLISFVTLSLFSQSKNVTFLGNKTYTKKLSDIWGYVDPQGVEYALVGVSDGTSIVDVSNPANPVEKFFVPGPFSTWRDLKVWNKHLYVTNETSGGVTIIDLTYLPDSIKTSTWTGNNSVNFTKAHNIFIDEKGFAFIFGANYSAGGAIIADLKPNPKAPQVVSVYDEAYLHDGFVRNDTLWSAELYLGRFALVDVSDKSSPIIGPSKILGHHTTPSNFTHNVWPSDDGKYAFTTDEVSNAFIGSYDIQDVTDIKELDRIKSSPGSGVIPHNVFFYNDFLVTAYYRDGLTIMDASEPDNIILTGYYDTSPLSGNGFNGAWGVYPYLPSGNIIVSDIENGLFVLSSNYKKAARIKGTVTDMFTNAPINNAVIEIVGKNISDNSDLTGNYKTGLADAGTYNIKVTKFGYFDTIITNVALVNGNMTILDINLIPMNAISVQVEIRDINTNQLIPNVKLQINNSSFMSETTVSSGSNSFTLYPNQFSFYAAKWGYLPVHVDTLIDTSTSPLVLYMEEGYKDEFMLDLGWQRSGNASTGLWEIGVPNGTFSNGVPSNPNADIPGDFGDKSYVTGNADTDQVGADDVDNGRTVITSPVMDLSGYDYPEISYYRWFTNYGGSGNPDDSLIVSISNGTSSVIIDVIKGGDSNQHMWVQKTIAVKPHITLSNNMTISFTATDEDPGHVVEAGLDGFIVTEGVNPNTAVIAPQHNISMDIYPNPFSSSFTVDYELNIHTSKGKLVIYDIAGRIVKAVELKNAKGKIIITDFDQPGIYFVKVLSDGNELITKRIINIQ